MILKSKKILFIMTHLPGYKEEIVNELRNRNYTVHILNGCGKPPKEKIPKIHRVTRALVHDLGLQALSNHLEKKERQFYQPLLEPLSDDYDFLFDFGGHAQENCLKMLKKKLSAKFILYLWDDTEYIPSNHQRFKYFDEVYSYSQHDCNNLGFKYQPSFFTKKFTYNHEPKNINIFYKGTLRELKRSKIISIIDKTTDSTKNDVTLYTKHGYIKNFFKVPSQKFFNLFCNHSYMSLSEISNKTKHARSTIDITFKSQKGLSLRVLESIAANCKIITTNENIKNYDFYNDNILIIDEFGKNIKHIPEFISTDFTPYPSELTQKYSVANFVDKILSSTR